MMAPFLILALFAFVLWPIVTSFRAYDKLHRCRHVGAKLSASLKASQLLVAGVLESHLLLITYNPGNYSQTVYEIPLSQLHPVTFDLTGVEPVPLSKRWSNISKSSIFQSKVIANIISNKSSLRILAIERATSQLVIPLPFDKLPNGDNANGGWTNRSKVRACVIAEIYFDTEHVKTGYLYTWHLNILQSPIWLSSAKPGYFYVIDNEAQPFTLIEFHIFATSFFFVKPSLWLKMCNHGGGQLIMMANGTYCNKFFDWLPQVRHGFTDQKWFRLFANDHMYVFNHSALHHPGKPVRIFRVPYDDTLTTCKLAQTKITLLIVSSTLSTIILAMVITWIAIFCWPKKKASWQAERLPSRISAYANMVRTDKVTDSASLKTKHSLPARGGSKGSMKALIPRIASRGTLGSRAKRRKTSKATLKRSPGSSNRKVVRHGSRGTVERKRTQSREKHRHRQTHNHERVSNRSKHKRIRSHKSSRSH